jgi:hypothetical protein
VVPERTFDTTARCYSDADIVVLPYDPRRTDGRFQDRRVRVPFLQPSAAGQHRFRHWLPLLPLSAGRLTVEVARLVISGSRHSRTACSRPAVSYMCATATPRALEPPAPHPLHLSARESESSRAVDSA